MQILKRLMIIAVFQLQVSHLQAQSMTIESLDGAVSAAEVNSFKTFLKTIQPAQTNKGNSWVYGTSGAAMEAMGMMYEVSKDTAVLNQMIRFADQALHIRNSDDTGRVIWTGKKELCWPNKDLTAADSAYSGSENGDVLAHIAYCAKLIITEKKLWHRKVAIGDPYQFGETYIQRAKKYILESDRTIDSFVLPNFVNKEDHKFYWPQNAQWEKLGARYKKDGGKGIPWNQQAMLAGGFQRLAECHELLGDQPERVDLYDLIVKTNIDWFLSQLVSYSANGYDCYKWSYAVNDPELKYMEDMGHAGYDVWGVFRAYERTKYAIPSTVIEKIANTVQYVIYKGDGSFATRVDGSGDVKNTIGASFLNLAKYRKELYPIIATANLELSKTKLNYFAQTIWIKNLL